MTQVFSIFERLGMGGGGKVRAVFHRMNALAEMPGIQPILLNLDHSINQKLLFADLQAKGTIAPAVRHLTLPEACHTTAQTTPPTTPQNPAYSFPKFDQIQTSGHKTTYLQDGTAVMTDRTKTTAIGPITKRTVHSTSRDLSYILLNTALHQMTERKPDGTIETTDFAAGTPIRWIKTKDGKFVIGKNLVRDTICRMERIYHQNIFDMATTDAAVVFFDGVTSAYLASVTKGQRALFLHADHRGPNGQIVPRSKFLIENFKGEAIITSTQVHKAQIEKDLVPAAQVHVIPHFCDSSATPLPPQTRQHLVTVSRLELTGKPIHECITAFCQIMDDFPKIDYLIYGTGAGQAQLAAQIADLGCGHRVHLQGYTTEPQRVFQNALASVYPTTTEGFGLSILEALSNGCPVMSYDVNYGPREMIKPGQNGELVPPGDIGAIAAALRRMLSQPTRYQRATSLGLDRYTRTAYLANYRAFVTTLAAQTRTL